MKEIIFTKKDLKLIKESLMAYGVGEDEEDSKIYDKISKLINKPVTTTNEQPTHLVLMYNYPHEFVRNISKTKYCKGFTREEKLCTKFIPIKLGEL